MPDPVVYIVSASLELDGSLLDCVLSHVELAPDTATVEVKTMCATVDYPGNVKWTLKATLYQSWDAITGTHAILSPIVAAGVMVPYTIIPYRDRPVSATNPAFAGNVLPQEYPPIIGDAGDASSFDIEWSLDGKPTESTTPAALEAFRAAAADEEGEPAAVEAPVEEPAPA
jgi:hypothetical protein